MASAATAGAASATFTSPIWLIKTRMQLQSDAVGANRLAVRKYRNSLDCAKTVVKEEGIRGFYKGLSASYLGKLMY
jgi:solute carrier family 25 protein 33/36